MRKFCPNRLFGEIPLWLKICFSTDGVCGIKFISFCCIGYLLTSEIFNLCRYEVWPGLSTACARLYRSFIASLSGCRSSRSMALSPAINSLHVFRSFINILVSAYETLPQPNKTYPHKKEETRETTETQRYEYTPHLNPHPQGARKLSLPRLS